MPCFYNLDQFFMFYILWVYNPLGSIEHEINWIELNWIELMNNVYSYN